MEKNKILSWNINGIRAGIKKGFLESMNVIKPDIICKQETKAHPDQVDLDLADYKNSEPNSKFNSLHFYAFGGIKKTSEWLNKIKKSELNYNSNNKFGPFLHSCQTS